MFRDRKINLSPFVRLYFVTLVVFFYSSSCFTSERGDDVYDRMVDAYNKITDYHDNGFVDVQYNRYGNIGNVRRLIEFKTKYKSNGGFSFEWKKHLSNLSHKIERKKGVITFYSNGKSKVESNLNIALGRYSGVTEGSSYLIPVFLLKDIALFDKEKISNISVEDVSGDEGSRYKLTIDFKTSSKNIFWLNKKYFIIKHTSQLKIRDGVHVITTTSIKIKK